MTKPHILMIDDDADDRMIMEDTLHELNVEHTLTLASGGRQALSLLEKLFSENNLPSMIVLDLNMPVLNGIQTLQMIRSDQRFNAIPVTIYSTSVNPVEKDKALSLGITGYEMKPTSFSEAATVCRRILNLN